MRLPWGRIQKDQVAEDDENGAQADDASEDESESAAGDSIHDSLEHSSDGDSGEEDSQAGRFRLEIEKVVVGCAAADTVET